jgi:hypothetical protein
MFIPFDPHKKGFVPARLRRLLWSKDKCRNTNEPTKVSKNFEGQFVHSLIIGYGILLGYTWNHLDFEH